MKRIIQLLAGIGILTFGNLHAQSIEIPQRENPNRANIIYRLDKISTSDNSQTFKYYYKEKTIPTKIEISTTNLVTNVDSLLYREDGKLIQIRNYRPNTTKNRLDLVQVEDYIYDDINRLIRREERSSLDSKIVVKKINYHYCGCGYSEPIEITTEMSDGHYISHMMSFQDDKLIGIDVWEQENSSSELMQTGRKTYEYNENDDIITCRDSIMLTDSGEWIEKNVQHYTYDKLHNCTRWETHKDGKILSAEEFAYDTSIPIASVLFPTFEDYFRPILPKHIENMRIQQTSYKKSEEGEGLVKICDYNYFYTNMKEGTSIEDVAGKKSINIFPRPATDFLQIEGSGLSKLTMFDAQGRIVKRIDLSGDMAVIGVASLPRGFYLVVVEAADQTKQTKVMLK